MEKQVQQYNRIKAALAEKGNTSKELAEALEVHKQTVSTWCRNLKQPSLQELYKIADFLQMDVRDLLVPNKFSSAESRRV